MTAGPEDSNSDPAPIPASTVLPPVDYWVGGIGPPRVTFSLGKARPYNDGAGLTSPGRWDKEFRVFPKGPHWNALRNDLNLELTKTFGKSLGRLPFTFACTPSEEVFDEACIARGREMLHKWLGDRDPLYTAARAQGDVAEGQPFYLKMLSGLLKEMKDPDYQILLDFETGVTAGILHPLPRNPSMFEEQTSWRLQQDDLYLAELQAENYQSLEGHIKEVESKFGSRRQGRVSNNIRSRPYCKA